MKHRTHRTFIVALLLVAGQAGATTYTTNDYSATSTSDKMGESCKEVSIDSSTGVVSAKCNKKSSGEVVTNDTTFNVKDATHCKERTQGGASLIWGTGTTSWTAADWTTGVGSNGRHYGAYVKCKKTGMPDSDGGLAISDNMQGLENDDGDLAKRTAP